MPSVLKKKITDGSTILTFASVKLAFSLKAKAL